MILPESNLCQKLYWPFLQSIEEGLLTGGLRTPKQLHHCTVSPHPRWQVSFLLTRFHFLCTFRSTKQLLGTRKCKGWNLMWESCDPLVPLKKDCQELRYQCRPSYHLSALFSWLPWLLVKNVFPAPRRDGGHTTEIRKTARPLQPRTLDSSISKLSRAVQTAGWSFWPLPI